MKLAIDQSLELEFDPYFIERAHDHLVDLRDKYKDHPQQAERVVNALLAVLLFAQMEHQAPGAIERIRHACDTVVQMQKPQTKGDT